MTIARTILDANLDDNIVIDENELMAEAADACIDASIWKDEDGYTRAIYIFSDESRLYIRPCGPEVY